MIPYIASGRPKGLALSPPVNHAPRATPRLAIPSHPCAQIAELCDGQPPIVFPQPIHHEGRPRRRQLRAPRSRLLGLHRHLTQSTPVETDRESTRLNSSHLGSSYAVFCLEALL